MHLYVQGLCIKFLNSFLSMICTVDTNQSLSVVVFVVYLTASIKLDNDKNSLGPRPHGSDKCELWPQVILYGDESLVRRRPLPEIARIYCNGGV